MARNKTTVIAPLEIEARIIVPPAVRDITVAAAKRLGIPIHGLIAELCLALNRGDVSLGDAGEIRRRYPPYRTGIQRAWQNVENRVYAAVRRLGGVPADAVRDATGTLSERQVQRALDNLVTSGRVRYQGGRYDVADT